MDKTSRIILGLLPFLFSSSLYAASACQDITKQYYDYDKGLAAGTITQNAFPYAWQDMSWLLTKLGTPNNTRNFIQTIAIWKKYNYSITSEDGLITNSQGTKPPALQNYQGTPTIENANTALGPPDVMQTGSMTESSWTCDSNSNLTITSNQTQNAAIVSYKGTYCTETDATHATPQCQNFSNYHVNFPDYRTLGYGFQRADLYIQHPPVDPQYSDQQAITLATQQTIQMMNDQLHAGVTSITQLQTFAIKTLSSYYSNLKKCTPGTYIYARPFVLGGKLISGNEVAPFYYIASAKIQGVIDQKCIVETTAKIGKNTGSLSCKYTPQDLIQFTDSKAAMDATYPSNFDPNQVAVSKALLKSCQVFFNGELLPSS